MRNKCDRLIDAGDYDFLLEKGLEYTFGREPVNTNVIYTAVDDVPNQAVSNSALRLASSCLRGKCLLITLNMK